MFNVVAESFFLIPCLQVQLSVWKDEANGTLHGKRLDDPIDLTSDSEKEDGEFDYIDRKPVITEQPEAASSQPSQPTVQPPPKPTVSSTNVYSDFDFDAMIEEDQQEIHIAGPSPPSSPPSEAFMDTQPPVDDDEAMFDELDASFDFSALDGTTAAASTAQKSSVAVDDDEDMWDIVREMETEESTKQSESKAPQPPATATDQSAPRPTNDDGWDDMYA